jgi:V/A-type H+/Na+-transporting ATPase subunit E
MDVKDGLVAIATEVLRDAQKEAETQIIAAENEAKETLLVSKMQADQNYLSTANKAKVEAEAEEKRITSLADVEARNMLLQTKEKLVNEAFQKATERLESFVETDYYHIFLLKAIEQAAAKMGSKKLVVQVNEKDKTWLANGNLKDLSKRLGVDLELLDKTQTFIGGYIIQTSDGTITYNDTLDNRLAELRIVLRSEIANWLFMEAHH